MDSKKHLILLVDDNKFVLQSTQALLEGEGYLVDAFSDPETALAGFKPGRYDLVLSDLKMPRMTGLVLLEKIHETDKDVPFILMTAYAEMNVAIEAVRKDAFDFILKPYQPDYILKIIKKAVMQRAVQQEETSYKDKLKADVQAGADELASTLTELTEMSVEMVQRLVKISEYRDTDTGAHIKRIGLYSAVIAEALNLPGDFIETLKFSSPMHDIGKIGIPDSILLKAGPLSPGEFTIMKTHSFLGSKMLDGSKFRHLQMASRIALTHHERFTGGGYPQGLKGEEIPIEGRIVMLVDQYDAMRSKRPYKQPFSHEETYKLMVRGDERVRPEHFDPEVLLAFINNHAVFDDIYNSNSDYPPALRSMAEL